jgi:hypothetical protein
MNEEDWEGSTQVIVVHSVRCYMAISIIKARELQRRLI